MSNPEASVGERLGKKGKEVMEPMETMRAAAALGDANGLSEGRRQRVGREALASALGEKRLSGLVECSMCGLLDNTDPCGDHL